MREALVRNIWRILVVVCILIGVGWGMSAYKRRKTATPTATAADQGEKPLTGDYSRKGNYHRLPKDADHTIITIPPVGAGKACDANGPWTQWFIRPIHSRRFVAVADNTYTVEMWFVNDTKTIAHINPVQKINFATRIGAERYCNENSTAVTLSIDLN